MSDPAIRVTGLGKKYSLTHGGAKGVYRSFRETLVDAVKAPFRKWTKKEDFWALSDVSFDVQPGEVLGIIGRNGAGKSTLLKILSRITKPTTGRVEINGRVGSLLEVGTGFHPELTGRENVYLNGSILGMSRAEVKKKFDEIVAFAEVEKFLDTPVKRYSSGMYVRLAFAVAAHLEPEILIVDEVLAVGDQEFQKKCLGKMGDVSAHGRTVIFVSHNMNAMATLAPQSVLLKNGQIIGHGSTRDMINRYLDVGHDYASEWRRAARSDGASIAAIRVKKSTGETSTQFAADEPFILEFECAFSRPTEAQLAFRLNENRDGKTVFTSSLSDAQGQGFQQFDSGRFIANCHVPAYFLVPGFYHVLCALNNFGGAQHDLVERALSFEVTEIGSLGRFDGRLGMVQPLMPWAVVQDTNPMRTPGEKAHA